MSQSKTSLIYGNTYYAVMTKDEFLIGGHRVDSLRHALGARGLSGSYSTSDHHPKILGKIVLSIKREDAAYFGTIIENMCALGANILIHGIHD